MKYFLRKINQLFIAFCLGVFLSFAIDASITIKSSPVLGQSMRPEMVAEQLYQSFDFLPLENEYVNESSGQVVSNNTLMLRFLRYHEYVKSRPVIYRFDWQLTFADYFQVNEPIQANRYPGHRTLATNPLESDRKAITKLTRNQRNQLIDALLAIHNPQAEISPQQPATTPDDSSEERNPIPSLPQPGDADLLLPNNKQ